MHAPIPWASAGRTVFFWALEGWHRHWAITHHGGVILMVSASFDIHFFPQRSSTGTDTVHPVDSIIEEDIWLGFLL